MSETQENITLALEDALAACHRRLESALGALVGMVNQHCGGEDGRIDSMALTANAWAMETLDAEGRIIIEPPIVGRRVIADWPKKAAPETTEAAP